MSVPEVLLSGNHQMIEKWQRYKSLELTIQNRPDLLTQHPDLVKEFEELEFFFKNNY